MKLSLFNEFVDFPESPNLCSWMALPAIASWGATALGASATTAATVGTVAQGVAIAGTVATAAGAMSAAADNAEAEAESFQVQGRMNKAAVERQGTALMAKNIARAEASNVDPFSGSSLETQLDNAFNLGKEKSLIDYDTKMKVRRSRNQGQQEAQHALGSAIGSFGSILGKGYQLSMGGPHQTVAPGSMGTGWGPSNVWGIT